MADAAEEVLKQYKAHVGDDVASVLKRYESILNRLTQLHEYEDEIVDEEHYSSEKDLQTEQDNENMNTLRRPSTGVHGSGFFAIPEPLAEENKALQANLKAKEEELAKLRARKVNEISIQAAALRVTQAKLASMFKNSTNKLFANIMPQVWTQIVQVHQHYGDQPMPVSGDQGIIPVLQHHFGSNNTKYTNFLELMQQNQKSGTEKVELNFVESYVHSLIVHILQVIGFPADDTLWDYSLTKALTPFVLHMFVAGQHIPNICVAFILDMCLVVPHLNSDGTINDNQFKSLQEVAQKVVKACLSHEYGVVVSTEEFENLSQKYVDMYDVFWDTYNENIKSFAGITKQQWPTNSNIIEMYESLLGSLPEPMIIGFRNAQHPFLLRF